MRYLISRLLQGVLILLGVSLVTFMIPYIFSSPSESALAVLGQRATQAAIKAFMHKYGLDRPLLVQYWDWLRHALQGNMGISFIDTERVHQTITVNQVVGANVWRSIWLTFIPTVFSALIAIPIGLSQAVRRNKTYDHVVTTLVYVVYSTPAVIICLLLVYYVAISLHIGTVNISPLAQEVTASQFPMWALQHANQFLLPFTAIIVLSIGGLTRFMRGSALDTLIQDHVRTARAKGASPTRVLFRHVLRPSVIPLVTIFGLSIPGIIGGALIIENIFNYPGMGVLAVKSVTIGDYPIVMALTFYGAILTIVGNYIADVLVAVVDPRARRGVA